MKKKIQQLLGEAKGKMNGYVALLAFRYSNLCVKADAMSLLPVTVKVDGEELNIESVADVGSPKEDVLAVVPKDPVYLYEIGKGVMEAHPEFKMDILQNEKSDDEEDKSLTFTMPEVDKNRRDILNNGVEGLFNQCKAKVDTILEQYTAKIGTELMGADLSVIDSVKDKLKDFYGFYDDLMKKLTDTSSPSFSSDTP